MRCHICVLASREQYRSHPVISEQSSQCRLSDFGIFSSSYTREKSKIKWFVVITYTCIVLPSSADVLCEMDITVCSLTTRFNTASTFFSVSASRFAVISSSKDFFRNCCNYFPFNQYFSSPSQQLPMQILLRPHHVLQYLYQRLRLCRFF